MSQYTESREKDEHKNKDQYCESSEEKGFEDKIESEFEAGQTYKNSTGRKRTILAVTLEFGSYKIEWVDPKGKHHVCKASTFRKWRKS